MEVENGPQKSKSAVNGWAVAQTATGGLLVAGVLALSGMVSGLRDTVRDHELLMGQLIEFQNHGERYTKEHGNVEKNARVEGDRLLQKELEREFREHRKEMKGLKEGIKENRENISIHALVREHEGAKYRLRNLEDRFGLKVLEFDGE